MADAGVVVVVDNSPGTSCAGFVGDDAPRVVFPTIVGWPRFRGVGAAEPSRFLVGSDARGSPDVVEKHPIEQGLVTNWEDMEKVYSQSLKWDENMES